MNTKQSRRRGRHSQQTAGASLGLLSGPVVASKRKHTIAMPTNCRGQSTSKLQYYSCVTESVLATSHLGMPLHVHPSGWKTLVEWA